MEKSTNATKLGLAEMLKGGVIMDVVDAQQEKIAEDWVTDNMITLRDALATSKAKGKLAVERVLNEYTDKLGLERVKTDKFYGRYTLAQAPELAPSAFAVAGLYFWTMPSPFPATHT